jgi:ubiquinone/menaquinone biosynthesis C-methylase UbiE
MSNSCLTIKSIIDAGTNIETAFKEALRVSNMLGCCIEFTFNSINCIAMPEGDYKKGVENYHTAIKEDDKMQYYAYTH